MSVTGTSTFTRTNAHYIATKIAADLRQMNRFYGQPSLAMVENYLEELTELIAARYLSVFENGFENDGIRVLSVRYEIRSDGTMSDDRSGRVPAGVDIGTAEYFNWVSYTQDFLDLSPDERSAFKAKLPVTRGYHDEYSNGSGSWSYDRSYSSGGTGAARGVYKPL